MVLAGVNCAAWFVFIAFIPPLPATEDPVQRERAERDADEARGWPNGMTIISHPPSLLAGRRVAISLAEKPVLLMAGPAVAFVEEHVVPNKYWQTGPTVTESYWIAAVAFVVSTAWWLNAPSLVVWVRRRFTASRRDTTT